MMRHGIRRLALGIALLVAAPAVRSASAVEATCAVRYVSFQHVYLDAGSEAGLSPGMQVQVVRGGAVVARLEVIYTARSSSSCKVLDGAEAISPGDTVVYETEVMIETGPLPETIRPRGRSRPRSSPAERPVAATRGARVSGSVALQWDQSVQSEGGDLESTLWRVPFRVRVSDLAAGLQFRSSGSLRRVERSGYPAYLPDGQWRNRIREISLVREGRRQAVHFAAGRIRTRATALTGPLDGFSLDRRWSEDLRLGVFAGFVPDWENLGFSTDSRLLGAGMRYLRGLATGRRFDLYLAGVGRYHKDGVSREWLGWTAACSEGRRWRLQHAAEVDLERGWREREDGRTLRLTSLALTGRYEFSRRFSLDLGYDDREPVRLWENRSLPDSLFTDAGRTQWRTRVGGEGPGRSRWSAGGGVRTPADGSGRTWSWDGRVAVPWARLASRFDLSFRGFDGPRLSGWSPALGSSGICREELDWAFARAPTATRIRRAWTPATPIGWSWQVTDVWAGTGPGRPSGGRIGVPVSRADDCSWN